MTFLQKNNVILNVDGEVNTITTYAQTVKELIDDEGIVIEEGAFVSPSIDTEIENNLEIIIINPKDYTILVDGKSIEITTIKTKTKDILKEAGVVLSSLDQTNPSLESKVNDKGTIRVYRVEEKIVTTEEKIPFDKQVIDNSRLDVGITKTLQTGKEGLKRTQVIEKYVDGNLVSSIIISDNIIEEPVAQVIEKGTKNVISTSRGSTRFKKSLIMTATAYDNSYASTGKRPGDPYYGITASGTYARPGTVAVDPRVIPLGTKLYIESLDGSKDYGFAIAEDVGGAIKGNKIDLFFNTSWEVKNFGRRKVKVYILE
ncbi:MAG: G5 domain-containing protein [Tissierellales bacterium]|nr:G5 domain-containing protein [Tissierellales bacterium]